MATKSRRMPALAEAELTELCWGKHRGRTLDEVAVVDPLYLDWLYSQDWMLEPKNLELRRCVGKVLGRDDVAEAVESRVQFRLGGRN